MVKGGLSEEVTCDLSPVAEKEPAVEGVGRRVFRWREQHVPGPEAAPRLAGLRNSRRQGWLEGRVGKVRLAWVARARWHEPRVHREQFGFHSQWSEEPLEGFQHGCVMV